MTLSPPKINLKPSLSALMMPVNNAAPNDTPFILLMQTQNDAGNGEVDE